MDKFIVTIARGFGSGGRTIGQMLSKKLGVEFYDKDIIKLASEESGINEALFGQSDERTKGGFGKRSVYKGEVISPDKKAFTSEENLFNYTAKVIKQLADEKSCIIVGRCADFVLRDRKDTIRVFVWADEENCVKNAAEVKGLVDRKEALKTITATDRSRAEYYKAHTGKDWNDARNYDICLNSGDLGFEKCVDIIENYIKIKLG
ncbi:MAG: cytidylate kinase-like family protein [Oscillospiraceae bacterium]|nr:cytidylate kinase-like family protein [Oscillospiraceae bacterium]